MPTPSTAVSSAPRKRHERERLLAELEQLCSTLQPGTRIPTHSELMRRYDASERAILRVLEDLTRAGKIVRQQGKGTFVAESTTQLPRQHLLPEVAVDAKTIVAILRPDQSFFDQCLDILFHKARALGQSVVCHLVDGTEDWHLMPFSEERRPTGFIVFSDHLSPIASRLQDAGHRVVVVGQPLLGQRKDIPHVYGDQEQGGYLAVRHLIELGHRRIAFCGAGWSEGWFRGNGHNRAIAEWNSGHSSTFSRSALRARTPGAKSGENRSPLQITVIPIERIEAWEANPQLARDFFSVQNAPTALVAWNDHDALCHLRTLLRAGIQVPEQVSLVGYDDLPEGRLAFPSLTTLSPQVEQQMQIAVNLLTSSEPIPPHHSVVLVPSLLPRESTRRLETSLT